MRRWLFAGLMLGWLAVRAVAADPVEIKPRWIAGKQYVTSTQTTQKASTAGPVKLDQSVATTVDASVTVRPHEDGKRKRLASGELGLDLYNMRPALEKAGLVYLDSLEDLADHG